MTSPNSVGLMLLPIEEFADKVVLLLILHLVLLLTHVFFLAFTILLSDFFKLFFFQQNFFLFRLLGTSNLHFDLFTLFLFLGLLLLQGGVSSLFLIGNLNLHIGYFVIVVRFNLGTSGFLNHFTLLEDLYIILIILKVILFLGNFGVFSSVNLLFQLGAHILSLLSENLLFLFCVMLFTLRIIFNDGVPFTLSHSNTFVACHSNDSFFKISFSLRKNLTFLRLHSFKVLCRVFSAVCYFRASVRFQIIVITL